MLELVQTLNAHEDRVWCVSWDHTGNLLASCGSDHSLKIWGPKPNSNANNDVSKLELNCLNTFSDEHSRTIRWVSWSPCGNMLATASFDSTIVIWKKKSASDYEVIANLEGHENEVKCTAWSPDGAFLASCSRDKSVWIWDVTDDEFECSSVLTSHSQDVKHVLWHPRKNLLVSSSYDNTIKIYEQDVDDWVCTNTLESHESTVWSCDFNADGTKLISCSDDKTLKVWTENEDTSSKKSTWTLSYTVVGYHQQTIYSIKWCNLTNLILTASADNAIRIFKENPYGHNDNEPKLILLHTENEAHKQDCNCVDWHPVNSSMFASCSDDGKIKLWRFLE